MVFLFKLFYDQFLGRNAMNAKAKAANSDVAASKGQALLDIASLPKATKLAHAIPGFPDSR